jgi:hypothetical protein
MWLNDRCSKENGSMTHLVRILMFDEQQDQVGLMTLQVSFDVVQ